MTYVVVVAELSLDHLAECYRDGESEAYKYCGVKLLSAKAKGYDYPTNPMISRDIENVLKKLRLPEPRIPINSLEELYTYLAPWANDNPLTMFVFEFSRRISCISDNSLESIDKVWMSIIARFQPSVQQRIVDEIWTSVQRGFQSVELPSLQAQVYNVVRLQQRQTMQIQQAFERLAREKEALERRLALLAPGERK